jgi:hypothetical protein
MIFYGTSLGALIPQTDHGLWALRGLPLKLHLEHLHPRPQNGSQNVADALFGFGAKTRSHPRPQNHAGIGASPINEPTIEVVDANTGKARL